MSRPTVLGLGATAPFALMLALAAFALPASARASAPVRYRLTRSVPLGAPDRWDYVVHDAPSHRVYVAHGNRLTVVDGRNGRIIGQVGPIAGGPHGIAISHATGLGFTDDGRAGEAVVFDLKTLKIVKRLKVQRGADAVTIDPVSGHVFVIDGDAGSVAVIDPASERVVDTVHIGSDLEYAVPGDNGKLYVNGVARRVIFRIDTATNRVDAVWPIPKCRSPHGLAIDTTTHRLFSSCENGRLVVINADTGVTVATLPIGRGTDSARFDSVRNLIFSSNGLDGTLSIVREVNADTFVPAGTVRTALSGRTMGIDQVSGRVYVAAAHTTRKAFGAFVAAWHSGKRPRSPFTPGSLRLLFLDPAR